MTRPVIPVSPGPDRPVTTTAEMPTVEKRGDEQSQLLAPPFPFGGPAMNVGPVPGGSAADRPAGLRKHAALTPLVHGDAGYAELRGDLSQSDRLAILHEKECIESLDRWLARTDNQYMTNLAKTSDVAIRCLTCGHLTQTVLAGSLPNFARGECGHYGRVIKVRITEKECGGACQSAKRGTCDCSCGGENHGIAT